MAPPMRPIFRRCSARGAPARNTRTMVRPAIEHALGLMLGACSFLLVGFDHACPRFGRLELGPCHACPRFGSRLESCLSPIRAGGSPRQLIRERACPILAERCALDVRRHRARRKRKHGESEGKGDGDGDAKRLHGGKSNAEIGCRDTSQNRHRRMGVAIERKFSPMVRERAKSK